MKFPVVRVITEFPGGTPVKRNADRKKIAPFESFLVEDDTHSSFQPELTPLTITLPRELSCRRLDLNCLRLGQWEMDLNGMRREVSAAPLVNQIDEGDFLWRPKECHYFGWMPDLEAPIQSVSYRRTLILNDRNAGRDAELMIEPGSLKGEWDIRINGGRPLTEKNLIPREYPVRGTEGVGIEDFLRKGENLIEIHCETTRLDEGLVSPLYLAGRFTVKEDDSLSEGNQEGNMGIVPFEDYRKMGLPYYSGRLLYSFDFDYQPEEKKGEKILLEVITPIPFQEAMEISLNGGAFLPMPWIPYRAPAKSSALVEGKNHVDIRVSTSLIRTFEGARFDIGKHQYEIC